MTAGCKAYGNAPTVRPCPAEVTHLVGVVAVTPPQVGRPVALPEQHIGWSPRCAEHAASYAYLPPYTCTEATPGGGETVLAVAILPISAAVGVPA